MFYIPYVYSAFNNFTYLVPDYLASNLIISLTTSTFYCGLGFHFCLLLVLMVGCSLISSLYSTIDNPNGRFYHPQHYMLPTLNKSGLKWYKFGF